MKKIYGLMLVGMMGAVPAPRVKADAPAQVKTAEFASVAEAVKALDNREMLTRMRAADWLVTQGDAGFSALETQLREEKTSLVFAVSALQRVPQKALPLFLELLPQNLFLKNRDGTRMEFGFGSEGGCIPLPNSTGMALADALGQMGDVRAIPVLREALAKSDDGVQTAAREALFLLKELSLDEMFAFGAQSWPALERFANRKSTTDPEVALSIFERALTEFAANDYIVASAHFWRANILRDTNKPQQARLEYQAVLQFPQFKELAAQATSAINTLDSPK